MTHRHVSILALGIALLASACGSSSGVSSPHGGDDPAATIVVAAPVTSEPAEQVGSIGDAVEVAVDGLAGADAAACDLERRVLADASELYLALNGSLPPTLDALVEAQFLSEPSTLFEITADGAIVPAPGSSCV